MVEQRLITPGIGIVRTKGCDPIALSAALYILVSGLVRRIEKVLGIIADAEADGGDGGAEASADAGDEVAADTGAESGSIDASGEMVAETAEKVAKLAARGVAAKEVQGKAVADD